MRKHNVQKNNRKKNTTTIETNQGTTRGKQQSRGEDIEQQQL